MTVLLEAGIDVNSSGYYLLFVHLMIQHSYCLWQFSFKLGLSSVDYVSSEPPDSIVCVTLLGTRLWSFSLMVSLIRD